LTSGHLVRARAGIDGREQIVTRVQAPATSGRCLMLTAGERAAYRRVIVLQEASPGDVQAADTDGDPELRAGGIEPDPLVVLTAALRRGVRASHSSGMLCVVGR